MNIHKLFPPKVAFASDGGAGAVGLTRSASPPQPQHLPKHLIDCSVVLIHVDSPFSYERVLRGKCKYTETLDARGLSNDSAGRTALLGRAKEIDIVIFTFYDPHSAFADLFISQLRKANPALCIATTSASSEQAHNRVADLVISMADAQEHIFSNTVVISNWLASQLTNMLANSPIEASI